jgi:hypothetical protein
MMLSPPPLSCHVPDPASKPATEILSAHPPVIRLTEIENRQDRLLAELDCLNGKIEQALEGLLGTKAAA